MLSKVRPSLFPIETACAGLFSTCIIVSLLVLVAIYRNPAHCEVRVRARALESRDASDEWIAA